MLALGAWAAVLAWAPRSLAPDAGVRSSWLATAALAALGATTLAVARAGPGEKLELGLLVQTATALAIFDLRRLIIPDLYSLALGMVGVCGPLSPGWPAAAAGALTGGCLLGAVRWAVGRRLGREAMGWGDVKLSVALGALLGPLLLLWTVAAAAGVGASVGLLLHARAARPRIPLGAFLAPAGVAMLWIAST